jgi:hypothetical protein
MARVSVSSCASSRNSSSDDDIDAITPCPLAPVEDAPKTPQLTTATDFARHSRASSPSSLDESVPASPVGFERRRSSIKTLEEGTDGNPERLWKRMLALQQIYGCYKSARMSAALELGDTNWLMRKWDRTARTPKHFTNTRDAASKACLDLMNEHMESLPDDAEAILKASFANRLGKAPGS